MRTIVHTSVMLNAETQYAASIKHHQLWVGTNSPGSSDLVISGDATAFENLAAALMLAVAEMREAELVEALGPSGQPSTPEVAA